MENNDFEIIVRGLITNRGRILVCKINDRDYYFLPGGHVEFGENMKKALLREIDEELGVKVKTATYIGSLENIFYQNDPKSARHDRLNHELNFVFNVEIDEEDLNSREDHISFRWFLPHDLIEERFVPQALRDAILKWMTDKKPFFILTEEELTL